MPSQDQLVTPPLSVNLIAAFGVFVMPFLAYPFDTNAMFIQVVAILYWTDRANITFASALKTKVIILTIAALMTIVATLINFQASSIIDGDPIFKVGVIYEIGGFVAAQRAK